jgi:hypothetical protein
MVALGRLCRVLTTGMISLMLAAVSYGASAAAAAGPDFTDALRLSRDARGEDVATGRNIGGPDRDDIEGGAAVHPTAAELRAIIQQTFSAGDLQALVGQAAGGAALELDPRVSQLAAGLGLEAGSLARMFGVLGTQEVPPAQLANVLAEIAARHLSLLARVRLLEGSEPRAAALRDAAAAAIGTAEHDRADALLAEAEALEFEAADQLPEALDLGAVPAAATYAPFGAIAGLPPRYGRAAAGAMLHGSDRATSEGPPPPVPSDRFCQGHPGHPLCERWAATSPLCEQEPNHPLCQGNNPFCRRHPDHKRCELPPSPS